MTTYTGALSYGQLSSLSVSSLLGNDRDSVAAKYQRALEVRHRVDGDLLLDTVNQLIEIQDGYRNFQYYLQYDVLDSITSVTKRLQILANKAITNVAKDLGKMFSMLDEYETTYKTQLNPLILSVNTALEDFANKAIQLKHVLMDWYTKPQGSAEYDITWAQELLQATYASTRHAKEVLLSFTNLMNSTATDSQDWADQLPNFLQSESSTRKTCRDVQSAVVSNMPSLLRLLNLEMNFSAPIPVDDIEEVQRLQSALSSFPLQALRMRDCNIQYETLITTIKTWMLPFDSSTASEMITLDSSSIYDRLDVGTKYLHDLLYNYTNGMTKLDLAHKVGGSAMDAVVQDIDAIYEDIKENVIQSMQIELTMQSKDTITKYLTAFSYAATFEKYFGGKKVTNARRIDLWKKPMADIDTKKVSGQKMYGRLPI